MRVFLLPVSTRRNLIYCERLQPSKLANTKLPISDRIINRAAQTWAEWERADKGWRKYLVVQGNKLLSRIAFEEWGLKSFPPLTKARLNEIQNGDLKFECVYPSRFLSAIRQQKSGQDETARAVLARLGIERQALHRRRMWSSLAWMPLSVPFTLVPVIPNIPFFYLCFRAYSHYRALYGGKLLTHLASTPGLLAIRSSEELEDVYARGLTGETEEASRSITNLSSKSLESIAEEVVTRSDNGGPETILLRPWSGVLLAEKIGVPEVQMEVERAVAQVQTSIEKTKQTPRDDNEDEKRSA